MQGILFKPEMLKAIIEGWKTVTRRLSNLKVINQEPDKWVFEGEDAEGQFIFHQTRPFIGNTQIIKPRYHVGQILYIKEAWRPYSEKQVRIEYKLDGAIIDYPKEPEFLFYACGQSWHSPLFLPAKFARHFIKIKDNKAIRLLPMTDEEAIKEGVTVIGRPELNDLSRGEFIKAYFNLWNEISPDYPALLNPYVFRYEYELIKTPINIMSEVKNE